MAHLPLVEEDGVVAVEVDVVVPEVAVDQRFDVPVLKLKF